MLTFREIDKTNYWGNGGSVTLHQFRFLLKLPNYQSKVANALVLTDGVTRGYLINF